MAVEDFRKRNDYVIDKCSEQKTYAAHERKTESVG